MKLAVYANNGANKAKIIVRGFRFDFDQLLRKIRAALNLPSSYQRIVYFDGSSAECVFDSLLFTEFVEVLKVYHFSGIKIVPIYIEGETDPHFDTTHFLKSRLKSDQIDKIQAGVDAVFVQVKVGQTAFVESEVMVEALHQSTNVFGTDTFFFGEPFYGEKFSLQDSFLDQSSKKQINKFEGTAIENPHSCDNSLILEQCKLSGQCECGHIVIGGEDYYLCILCSHISCFTCEKLRPHHHQMVLTEMSQLEELAIFAKEKEESPTEFDSTEFIESSFRPSLKSSFVCIISNVLKNPFKREKKAIKSKTII